MSINKFSFEKYSKEVCELSAEEIAIMSKEFPFRLQLAFRTLRGAPPVPVEFINSIDNGTDSSLFISLTNSMRPVEIEFVEDVCLQAYNYVKNNTVGFAQNFNSRKKHSDNDLVNWADCIVGEIGISREGEELEAFRELEKTLLENINDSKEEHQSIISELLIKIKEVQNKSLNLIK
mgnify:CR=1 FL=1